MFTCGLVRSKTAYVRAMLRAPAAPRLFLRAACSGLMLPPLRPCRAVRRNGAIDLNAVDMMRRCSEMHNARSKGETKEEEEKNVDGGGGENCTAPDQAFLVPNARRNFCSSSPSIKIFCAMLIGQL